MPDLSIVTVNFNGEKYFKKYLDSLKSQTYQNFEFIVVDNASTDNSLKIIEREYPSARIIKNPENLGYCKSVNLGIRISSGKYILTLNFDLILENRFLEEMVKAMESDPEIGSVSGKLLKLLEGQKTKIIDSTGHIIYRNRVVKNRGSGEMDKGQYDHREYIFGVCGAAPLFRKKMLEEIKWQDEYLDEDFISGYDDVDIDWRANLAGWKAFYTPYAVAYHVRGGAFVKISRKWRFLNFRNRYLLMLKNDTWNNILKDLPQILLFELGMLFSMIVQLHLIQVIFNFFRLLPKFLKKRQFIQSNRKASPKEIRKWFH